MNARINVGALLFLTGIIGSFAFALPAQAALSLTAGSNATTTPSVATSIIGFQIVGPSASTTPVKLRATNGTLNLSSVSGVTMSGNNSGTVSLSGTVEKLNQALATLKYTRASTGTDTLEVSLVESGEVFFEDNGHLYKFISGSITALNARTAAGNQTAYGATGYLATITSQAENDFVAARLQGDGWIGGSDEGTEGVWKWVTGPESGTTFWNGASGGSAPEGQYANWSSGEPNDWLNGSPGEDCIQFYITSTKWNDLNCTSNSLSGYVVEFGADGDMPTVVAQNISIVTADVPALTALSPVNGATSVSPSANLRLTFSKTVTKNTGDIIIRKYSDDSIVETVDASGSRVTANASTTAIIDLVADLEEGIQYYVTVSGTTFKDGSDNLFDGFANNSTWSFTTSDETAPTITNLEASTATTTADVTWDTNESASTRLWYSSDTSFASSTSETDTGTRVTAHEVTLNSLVACTLYHYKAVSRDAVGNTATSSNSTFITGGCVGAGTPSAATTTVITVNTAATSTLSKNDRLLSVVTPADFTATSSSVVIQIKSLVADTVIGAVGRPSATAYSAAVVAFDVTALVDNETVLDSFDAPVTITYVYTDEDVADIEESTIWLYHYHDGAWDALDDCIVDTAANIISCTTPSFSVFGLFGTRSSESVSGSVQSGVTLAGRIAYFLGVGNISSALELLREYIRIFFYRSPDTVLDPRQFDPNASASLPARDLELGMSGADVLKLQRFLNGKGHTVAASGDGSPGNETQYFGMMTQRALADYQKASGITPALGYFGAFTRERMRLLDAGYVWW